MFFARRLPRQRKPEEEPAADQSEDVSSEGLPPTQTEPAAVPDESELLRRLIGAIAQQESIRNIQNIVQSYPLLLRRKDIFGWLPLDYAAFYDAPLEVVQCLVDKRPDALLHRWRPLYIAVEYASPDVVQCLVDLCPDALLVKGKKGRPPLHYAAQKKASLEVVQCLVDKCPDALHVKENIGLLPMHIAARYASLEVVKFLADKNPDALLVKEKNGSLPLHLAAQHASLEVVQCLAVKCPNALLVQEKMGWLPLHFSARFAALEVVQCLADSCQEALLIKTNDGRLPLHLAVQHTSVAVVQYLADKCPNALLVEEKVGGLALHHAAYVKAPLEVVQCLADKGPEALLVRDKDGCLPLHIVAAQAPLDVVQYIADKCPDALLVKTNDGRLPLHLAAQYASLEVVEYLTNMSPEGLLVKMDDGRLPLHVAAQHASSKVVLWLADRDPDALLVQQDNGLLPLDYAAARNDSLKVVRRLRKRSIPRMLPLHIATMAGSAEREQLVVDRWDPLYCSPIRRTKKAVRFPADRRRPNAATKARKRCLSLDAAAAMERPEVVRILAENCVQTHMEKALDGVRPADPRLLEREGRMVTSGASFTDDESRNSENLPPPPRGRRSTDQPAIVTDARRRSLPGSASVTSFDSSAADNGTGKGEVDSGYVSGDHGILLASMPVDERFSAVSPPSVQKPRVDGLPRRMSPPAVHTPHILDALPTPAPLRCSVLACLRNTQPMQRELETLAELRMRMRRTRRAALRKAKSGYQRSLSETLRTKSTSHEHATACHQIIGEFGRFVKTHGHLNVEGDTPGRGWRSTAQKRGITSNDCDGGNVRDTKRRPPIQSQFWSNAGIETVIALINSLNKGHRVADANHAEHVTPGWVYQFHHTDMTWAETVPLCSTWLFPLGAPSHIMEPILIGAILKLIDYSRDSCIRINQLNCYRSSMIVTSHVSLSDENRWSPMELWVGLVTKESSVCVSTHDMGHLEAQRLIVCCKCFAGDACCAIRRGGLDDILALIRSTLMNEGQLFEEDARSERIVCPECLQSTHPNKAMTLGCDRDALAAAFSVFCSHGHRVDSRMLLGTIHDRDENARPTWSRVGALFVLRRSVVYVVASFSDNAVKVGSGFIADRPLGLVLSAGHTVDPSRDASVTQIVIVVQMGDSDGVEIRYAAVIAARGSENVDACVLRIIGRVDGDASVVKHFLSDITELTLACEPFLGENISLIGYNQGGEGVIPPGAIPDYQPDVLRGYVSKFFTIPLNGSTRHEIVVEGSGRVIPGHSGGPCLNASGEVVGTLSRSDCFDGRRWYLVPSSHLTVLLKTAREACPTAERQTAASARRRGRFGRGRRWKR
jgi:ankyrin repeat protein